MSSPFLGIPRDEWVAANDLAFAFRDRFPVTDGHILIVTRRLVPDWWSATRAEQIAILDLIDEVKTGLDASGSAPDGYNVGFNAGRAAGQTVDHLHVHVIPRRRGDMPDPRGGVRHVIPWKANYLHDAGPALLNGPHLPLATTLADALADSRLDEASLAVSFVLLSGLRVLDAALIEYLARDGTHLRLLAGDYLDVTEPAALRRLLNDQTSFPNLAVKLFHTDGTGFHPKAYLLHSRDHGGGLAFVGSANLSRSGLHTAVEWTLRTTQPPDLAELQAGFEALWDDPRARPLSPAVINDYEARRVVPLRAGGRHAPVVVEDDALPAPTPTPIQADALAALEQTRAAGFGAGLVVLATGLGKTWLAAFDSTRPHFGRVLFVAHREELLRQAMTVFRAAQPGRSVGLLKGTTDESTADTVFASLPTLARRLERLPPDTFDYLVVDEFHHAAAATYRRVLDHFRPRFLLGLTATPDRADGADLLALCDDNIVHEVSLVDGIRLDALVPFRYHGVADTVDFAQLPWRNRRFDPNAVEHAVVTDQRSQAAFDAWQRLRATRTLAFCLSQRHADHQAAFFAARGIRTASVHTGASSAPRHQTIAALAAGNLDVVFSVDLFNEGLDVPAVDTVLLLRPTDSPVLFLQQLGRGLRRAQGKNDVTVIDFVGNHRSFLRRPQELLRLAGADHSPAHVGRALASGDFSLPAGCSVDYDVDAVDLLNALARQRQAGGALERFAQNVWESEARRPTALETYRHDLNPATAKGEGGWFALLDRLGMLTPEEQAALRAAGPFLAEVSGTAMTKSYKMTLIRSLVLAQRLFEPVPVTDLSESSRRLMQRDPRLLDDLRSKEFPQPELVGPDAFARYWRTWPIAAWAGELSRADHPWASVTDDTFSLRINVPAQLQTPVTDMVAELIDWRMARYLDGRARAGAIEMKVSHTGGRPILFIDRARYPDLPTGTVDVRTADGTFYEFDFVKVAVNVARSPDRAGNQLPALLRSWFGDDAGLPGTRHRVALSSDRAQGWGISPMDLQVPAEEGTG